MNFSFPLKCFVVIFLVKVPTLLSHEIYLKRLNKCNLFYVNLALEKKLF